MSACCHNPIHCILPPYILGRLSQSTDAKIRKLAIDAIEFGAAMRAQRTVLATLPIMSAIPSPEGTKNRLVYDAKHGAAWFLPGQLVRAEGQKEVADAAINEAYDFSGDVYDFYKAIFSRNSLDDRGMSLISSVHMGQNFNNAFWNGEQMAYGDGDGSLFVRFTKALDVVGHELTHGVVTHTCNLQYQNDPILGTDPQPKHLRDKHTGSDDNGGVHINSGIPNHAFYRVATDIGGNAWEKAGLIWYKTLRALNQTSDFAQMVAETEASALALYGSGSLEQQAVQKAWKAVGF